MKQYENQIKMIEDQLAPFGFFGARENENTLFNLFRS